MSTSQGLAALAAPASTQRAGGLVELPALLRELGADTQRVLAAADLAADCLDHIESRIPVDRLDRLLAECVEQSGCPHFWMLAGQRWKLSHFGALGELMQCAPTVGDALRSFSVLQHLNSDVGAAFVLEKEETASFGYAVYRSEMQRPAEVYDAAMAIACNVLRELCRLHWSPREAVMARPTPSDSKPYRDFFGHNVRFNYPYSAVRFSSRWLAQPLAGADSMRHEAILRAIGAEDDINIVARLHRSLRLMLIGGHSSGNVLAEILSLHRRTLNRRLRAQGTTFQRLLDDVRLDVARQLLLHTDTPINEIAATLCYADVSSFMHAFRRWTGTSPGQFRQREGDA
jgi:AraC-like DNA-binding protein